MSDRVIPVEGSVNLRDFGGYRTTDGAIVSRSRLLRCGTLAYLTQRGMTQFQALEVGLICDLRRADEKASEPTPFPAGAPARLEIPIDPGSAVELRRHLESQEADFGKRVHYMTSLTGELTRDHAADYARMFDALLRMEDGAFLVHCSAGKDRTGVACALILHALGVGKETVIEDYLMTNEVIDYEGFIKPRLMTRLDPEHLDDKAMVMVLAGVREEYIEAAYAAIEERFDHVEHYLEDALGLSAGARSELKDRYLER